MLCDVLLMLDEFVANSLFGVDRARPKGGHAVDDVGDEVEAVQIVQHYHVERCRGCAFFLVAAHVQVLVVRAAIPTLRLRRQGAVSLWGITLPGIVGEHRPPKTDPAER